MSNPQLCPLCSGRGVLVVTLATPGGTVTYAHPCHGCAATGLVVTDYERADSQASPAVADRLRPFMN
jgi:DnaJ-class molecular chaperone